MAQNQRYPESRHIALTAPKDVKGGDPILVGGFAGVVLADAKSGEKVTVWLDGSWDVTVTGALTEGAVVSITSAGKLTATATGNTPWGLALAAKGSGDGVVEVAPLGRTIPVVGA